MFLVGQWVNIVDSGYLGVYCRLWLQRFCEGSASWADIFKIRKVHFQITVAVTICNHSACFCDGSLIRVALGSYFLRRS